MAATPGTWTGLAATALTALLAMALPWQPASAQAAPVFGPPGAGPPHRYRIDARVDTAHHRVRGQLVLHVTNTSRAPLDHLVWHLYANAFRDRNSVFFDEGGSALRRAPLRHPGYIRVTALQVRGRDLLDQLDTDLHPSDRTQARLPLQPALPPGESLALRVDFETQLPQIVARMGYAGDFHMLAQWFPKLAKLEPDGRFASFPYHGAGEFYGDFASYEVTLDVPKGPMAICGGERVAATPTTAEPGRRRVRYRLSPAHDVACVVASGMGALRASVDGIDVQVWAPAGYGPAQRRQLEVLRFGLGYLQQHFGAYPYGTLRAVIPTPSARAAGGMEYPGLITTGGPGFSLPIAGTDVAHDVVTAHELTHQWFYGVLANDEVSHPFLDEGLTEWITWQLLQALHGRRTSAAGLGAPAWLSPRALLAARGTFVTSRNRLSALKPAHHYQPQQLGGAVYLRPAMTLEAVARAHGHARVLAALGRYARAQRFRHPTPPDLYAAFDAEFGDGFARRELLARLAGERSLAPPSPTPGPATHTSRARDAWFGTLLFGVQALLRSLGP